VRLFHRSTRSITLTAEGALFLERCRRIFSESSGRAGAVADARGPTRHASCRPAMVGIDDAYSRRIHAGLSRDTIDLDFSDRVVDVIEEGFDAVCASPKLRLAFDDPGFGHISQIPSWRRPAYLAAKGVPLIPDDLRLMPALHHQFPTSRKLERWPLGPDMPGIETELPRTAVASTIEPLISMADKAWVWPVCPTSP